MQVYKGISALAEFRKTKILRSLKTISPNISDVSAEYVHFVDSGQLSATETNRLKQLLSYGSKYNEARQGKLVLIVPRPGTISPWSSKATDIAHNSGLTKVKRIERGVAYYIKSSGKFDQKLAASVLHDRMTEAVLSSVDSAKVLFASAKPRPVKHIDILAYGHEALETANQELGLALADDEIEYLYDSYKKLKRNPTDMELMMFGAVNSEHCRHKIFNADWVVNGKKQPKSLFQMIKNTYAKGGQDVLSAYSDNAAVLKGPTSGRFFANPSSGTYSYNNEAIHSVIKVETHNHPTAISPFAGAATGIGGEIRDEAATGRGAKSKMGLAGFSVSNLQIPGAKQPWEKSIGKPSRVASALDIMIDAPIGGSAYANEFGRPNLCGYFRTYEQAFNDQIWGYHKPIMVAGGLGNIRDMHVKKQKMTAGSKLIVLGGPAMLIGLGGGAASSMQTGDSAENLDFASVQRANAEVERRVQEVIDHCWALGRQNPILTIHDVGAGGLSNALPELVHDSDLGAMIDLRQIPNAEPGLSPMEIWCNEAQERYVLAIEPKNLKKFESICKRERCPFAVVGQASDNQQLTVNDPLFGNKPVDLPMEILFGKPPKMTKSFTDSSQNLPNLNITNIKLSEAVERVLQLPAVASKKFLITIGDRSVGGLVARDQMVGPWQVPVSDVAVTAASFKSDFGEAMAMGERTPLALIDSPASARIAVGEAITNIVSADIEKLSDVKLSANWMAAAGTESEDEKLFKTVKAVGEEFCPQLGLTIPVGKDSLSMRSVWQTSGRDMSVTSPVSLIISAFSPVQNVSKTLTPVLSLTGDTSLILIDLGAGQNRLGGSALAQVYNQVGSQTPDIDAQLLKKFFKVLTSLKRRGLILAYHDRSDGGLLTTLLEMAFASRCSLDIDIAGLKGTILEKLFNEEVGAVIQVKKTDQNKVLADLRQALGNHVFKIGQPGSSQTIVITDGKKQIYKNSRAELERLWASTSYHIQKLRDNPACADQEYKAVTANDDVGITPKLTFTPQVKAYKSRPKVAIFREQGVNGQIEMAAAFEKAGFASVDVHFNDLAAGNLKLDGFVGLAACGGFSYGDVLGAGEGWAKSVLFNQPLRRQLKEFFERDDTFTLGVCNGCQMLSALKDLIPGAQDWPEFLKNSSEQFEARLVMTKINKSPSIFFRGMAGSVLPVPVAHGEGRAHFDNPIKPNQLLKEALVPLQYVDNYQSVTDKYPLNPNGSTLGITALTTPDGRATIMMPHPERAFMTRQLSWHPRDWGEDSPWFQIFQNARQWVG